MGSSLFQALDGLGRAKTIFLSLSLTTESLEQAGTGYIGPNQSDCRILST